MLTDSTTHEVLGASAQAPHGVGTSSQQRCRGGTERTPYGAGEGNGPDRASSSARSRPAKKSAAVISTGMSGMTASRSSWLPSCVSGMPITKGDPLSAISWHRAQEVVRPRRRGLADEQGLRIAVERTGDEGPGRGVLAPYQHGQPAGPVDARVRLQRVDERERKAAVAALEVAHVERRRDRRDRRRGRACIDASAGASPVGV